MLLTALLTAVTFGSEAKTTNTITHTSKRTVLLPDYYTVSWEHCGQRIMVVVSSIDEYREMSDALWDYYCG